jgi:hypothetical protein
MFRFPDQVEFRILCAQAGFLANDNSLITASHTHAIDEVGTITRGGEWDDEGNVITPPETLDGWHVNYRGPVPEGWDAYAVFPQNPVRVWA